jgi:HlyD family secretion protein
MKKRPLFGALLILVFLAVGVLAYLLLRPRSNAENTAVVRRGSIQASVEALGRVEPARQLNLSLRTSGPVQRISVQEGQLVGKGTLLLELDPREALEAIEQAERTLQVRRLQLEEAQQAPSSAAIALARALLRRATAAREKAQKDYDQVAAEPGADSSSESLALETAKLEYEQAKAQYDQTMEGTQKLEIERLQSDVQDAELTLRQAQERLQDTQLRAPLTGTVMLIEAQEGENVGAYTALMHLADLSHLEIGAEIDEIDIPAVAQEQRVVIRLDAFPLQLLEGRIARLLPGVTDQRGSTTYRAIITYTGEDLPIRPGMGANLTIITQSIEGALLIPKRAVHQVGRQQVVRVLAGGHSRETIVVTGLFNDSEVQVLSGLEESQVVLLN